MKILHLADLHIGKKVYGYSMLEEQEYILCHETIEVIKKNDILAVLIAGDVYDTSIPSAQAVNIFDKFLTKLWECGVKVYVIPGNHDSADRIAFASELLNRNSIYIAKPINHDVDTAALEKYEIEDEYGKINIYLMPYLRSDEVNLVINNTSVDVNERNILVAHQFVTASGQINTESDSEVKNVGGLDDIDIKNFESFDYVALGHLHAPQHIGRESIRYAGSILKYSFSEVDQKKSFLILNFKEKGNINIEKTPIIPINDMRKIKGPIDMLLSKEVYLQGNISDYIQATITDEEEVFDALRRLREIYRNLLKLDFDNSRIRALNDIENIENVEQKSAIELFEEFYKNRTDMDLSVEEKKIMEEIIRKEGVVL